MKPLHTYIKDNKSSLISLTEKFRVTKDFKSYTLDEIYNFDWKYYDKACGIYYADEDRKAFDVFYKYLVHNAKQKITFHQQCRLVNKGKYLFAVNESEKTIYLFHRHMNLTYDASLYEKFEIIPSSNGMRINFIQMASKVGIYPLSTKSMFTVKGTNPQYYLIDENLWEEMKTLYNDLKTDENINNIYKR